MRTGFRRPRPDRDDETHELTRLPRDFEKVESESCAVEPGEEARGSDAGGAAGPRFEFTLHPDDLRPPLTGWLQSEGGVTVDYHTDLDDDPKGRYRLRAKDPAAVERDGWAGEPIRLVMEKRGE